MAATAVAAAASSAQKGNLNPNAKEFYPKNTTNNLQLICTYQHPFNFYNYSTTTAAAAAAAFPLPPPPPQTPPVQLPHNHFHGNYDPSNFFPTSNSDHHQHHLVTGTAASGMVMMGTSATASIHYCTTNFHYLNNPPVPVPVPVPVQQQIIPPRGPATPVQISPRPRPIRGAESWENVMMMRRRRTSRRSSGDGWRGCNNNTNNNIGTKQQQQQQQEEGFIGNYYYYYYSNNNNNNNNNNNTCARRGRVSKCCNYNNWGGGRWGRGERIRERGETERERERSERERERDREREKVIIMPPEVSPNGSETTAMIKNIPNQYTRGMLTKYLDEFCETENKKLIKDGASSDHSEETQADNHPPLAFDFLYLPIDFRSEANKGYAFVNFTHPIAVWKLHEAANNTRWKYCRSTKICQIAYATIQGKTKLKEHFTKSKFVCNKEEYLPVCFSPPRDGSGKPVTQTTIGDRVSSSFSIPRR